MHIVAYSIVFIIWMSFFFGLFQAYLWSFGASILILNADLNTLIKLVLVVGLNTIPLIVHILKRSFELDKVDLDKKIADLNNSCGKLKEDKAQLDNVNSRLDNQISAIASLYEIIKDISQSLDKEKILSIFKEVVNRYFRLEGCFLVSGPSEDEVKNLKALGYYLFNLKEGEGGYLAVKGVFRENLERFTILVQQLTLVLRKAHLYQVNEAYLPSISWGLLPQGELKMVL